jgi:hypothetical protein
VKNLATPVSAYRVVLTGVAGPRPDTAVAPPPPGASGSAPGADPRWRRFYVNAAMAGVLVAFFLAINLLSGSDRLWFQWPALPILLAFCLRTIRIFRH